VTRDEGLVAFVEALESHLRARRGTDHALSPRDFALARSWYEGGVPLATVLMGMDRALEGDAEPSLAFCRRRVEELAAAGFTSARDTPSSGGERIPVAEVQEVLSVLRERLQQLPAAGFALALRKIDELQDLLSVAARPNGEYVRAKLAQIDQEVSAAALQNLPPDADAALRAEAAGAAERHRGRVDTASLDDAVRRLLRLRARELLRLPRVSVLW
jgi:hypothetical protein